MKDQLEAQLNDLLALAEEVDEWEQEDMLCNNDDLSDRWHEEIAPEVIFALIEIAFAADKVDTQFYRPNGGKYNWEFDLDREKVLTNLHKVLHES